MLNSTCGILTSGIPLSFYLGVSSLVEFHFLHPQAPHWSSTTYNAMHRTSNFHGQLKAPTPFLYTCTCTCLYLFALAHLIFHVNTPWVYYCMCVCAYMYIQITEPCLTSIGLWARERVHRLLRSFKCCNSSRSTTCMIRNTKPHVESIVFMYIINGTSTYMYV